jgi:HSP20 family protein
LSKIDSNKLKQIENIRLENAIYQRKLNRTRKEGEAALKTQRKSNAEQLQRATQQGESQLLAQEANTNERMDKLQKNHMEKVELAMERARHAEENLDANLKSRLAKIKEAKEESLRLKRQNTDKMNDQVKNLQRLKNEQILHHSRKQDEAIINNKKRWAGTFQDLQKNMNEKFRDVRSEGERSLDNLKATNRRVMEAEKQLGERKLADLRKMQRRKEGEILENLKNQEFNSQAQIGNAQSELESRLEEQRQSADQAIYRTKDMTEKAITDLKNSSDSEIWDLRTRLKYERLKEAKNMSRANTDRTSHEMKQLKNRERMFQEKLADMAHTHRHAVNRQNTIYKKNLQHISKNQKDSLANAQKNFNERVHSAKRDSETALRRREVSHKESLSNIDSKLMKEREALLERMAKDFAIISRAEDSEFYQVQRLDAELSENEKSYSVKVNIPDYERKNLTVHVGKNSIRLTIARNYEGELKSPEGNDSFATNNFQTISKKIALSNEVDPKGFQKEYADGTVIVTVPKIS